MDDASHLFDYNAQDQVDGNYQEFDGLESKGPQNFPQSFTPIPFSGNAPLQTAPLLATSMQPPPVARSLLPARSPAQSEVGRYGLNTSIQRSLLPVPSFDAVILESPGLASRSFGSTPETRVSSQSITPITPKITPPDAFSNTHQPSSNPPERVFPPPAPMPPRRRRPRKPRPKPQLSQEEEEAKREKFLERNRVAAGKCRVKRKTWMTDLEDKMANLENQNSQLRMEHSALVIEINQARALLMTHTDCNDPRIDKWIENEAKRFVLGTGEHYDSILANFGFAAVSQPGSESIPSASGYTTSASNAELMNLTQGRSISLPQSISPTQRTSISLPQGIGMASSPVLLRTQVPHDPGGGPITLTDPAYLLASQVQVEDHVDMNPFSNVAHEML